jgi:HlyD family secretion protein
MLEELRQQDRIKDALQERQTGLQNEQIQSERNFMQLQGETLKKSLQDAETMAPMLKRRVEGLRTLRAQGLIADASAELLQAEDALLQNTTRMSDLNARLKQFDAQLKEQELRRASTERDNIESSTLRTNRIKDLASKISLAELQLSRSEIRSEYAGRIIEVIGTPGQVLTAGARIATIQIEDPEQILESVSYFNVADGKKIQRGMEVQVTPDPVERQRFGGITGVVESVSELPVTKEAALLVVGNPSTVDLLMPSGPFIQVTAKLHRDASTFSGFRWSSSAGPSMQISPGVTATGRVTVEGRAPITYIFPFLRSVSGIY